jgi:hypothetical protein
VVVVLRIQGEVDAGPTATHPDFTPLARVLPHLDALSRETASPLLIVIMGWERGGPWVYPEALPPVGGDEALLAFTEGVHERGWHLGTYCNGTQWVVAHHWSGYDGRQFFADADGPEAVCRTPTGESAVTQWDREWRSSHPCCVGSARTRAVSTEFVAALRRLGLDWIQYLDQNCGVASFPCYGEEHGHEPAPAAWMTAEMSRLLDELDRVGRAAEGLEEAAFSVESPPGDHFLSRFAMCDARLGSSPVGRGRNDIGLFHHLFHEFLRAQSAFAPAPDPYWVQLEVANALVMGEVLGCMLQAQGQLRNWSGEPWALWDESPGDQQAARTLLGRAAALRRGAGRDFLVGGRLLAAQGSIELSERVTWTHDGEVHDRPAVLCARWQAEDRRTAVAFANWTAGPKEAVFDVARPSRLCILADELVELEVVTAGALRQTLPALAVGMLIGPPARE